MIWGLLFIASFCILAFALIAVGWWWGNRQQDRLPKGFCACFRCGVANLEKANFCKSCGLMLVSHVTAMVWLNDQREFVKRRDGFEAFSQPRLSPAPPPRKGLPATAAPPPAGV